MCPHYLEAVSFRAGPSSPLPCPRTHLVEVTASHPDVLDVNLDAYEPLMNQIHWKWVHWPLKPLTGTTCLSVWTILTIWMKLLTLPLVWDTHLSMHIKIRLSYLPRDPSSNNVSLGCHAGTWSIPMGYLAQTDWISYSCWEVQYWNNTVRDTGGGMMPWSRLSIMYHSLWITARISYRCIPSSNIPSHYSSRQWHWPQVLHVSYRSFAWGIYYC